jgi:TPR repeat protein
MPENMSETLQLLNKRLEVNDPEAFYNVGAVYFIGQYVVQDKSKGLEYYIRGAELGSASASNAVAQAYDIGEGVAKNAKKAMHYYELAAMKGHTESRYNLGRSKANAGRCDKAVKHWLISCGRGVIMLWIILNSSLWKVLQPEKTTRRLFDHIKNTLAKSKAIRGMRLQRLAKDTDISRGTSR